MGLPANIRSIIAARVGAETMLGRRDPQASIFDGDQLYLDHVGKGSFYAYLAAERHHLFRDQDFADLYSAQRGRPSVPPSLLCAALVLQFHDRCSDQEAADRAAYDQRWKVALGTGELERPFAKSTLQLFRAQLLVHEKVRAPFEASLTAARRVGRLKGQGKIRVALDTTGILGRGAVKDTYNLIADGILSAMRALARLNHEPLQKWAQRQGLQRYLGSSLKGEANIDWDDQEARRALLTEEVKDAQSVLEMAGRARSGTAPGSREEERLLKASEVLSQILMQDVEPSSEGGSQIRQGTSGERICSVHDPDMRHGRKSARMRFDGHKLSIATDVESQLLVGVDVLAASAPDEQASLELAQQSEAATGLELEAALGDCAYGGGTNRQRFAEAGIPLLATVQARPETGYLSKDEFEIDLEKGTCRCPAGHITSQLVRAGHETRPDGTRVRLQAYRFAASVCGSCPLRQQCCAPSNQGGRTVTLNPFEALHQAARQWQQSPDFAAFRQQRQVVEHRIARMVQLGIRQARYFGRPKTLLQALMVATVANLTLLAAQTATGQALTPLLAALMLITALASVSSWLESAGQSRPARLCASSQGFHAVMPEWPFLGRTSRFPPRV